LAAGAADRRHLGQSQEAAVDVARVLSAIWEVASTLVIIALAVGALEGVLYLILVRWLRARLAVPLMLIAPAFVGLLGLIVYPLLWELNVSFTNMSISHFKDPGLLGLAQNMFVGFRNYTDVLTQPVLQEAGFWQVLWQTVIWTTLNVTFHVAGGLGLALLLNRQLPLKGVYRALIVLPWAVPQIVALAVWRTEYQPEFGVINQLLGMVGISPGPDWLTDPFWNFAAMVITNVWLGIPFMMVILLGGLQSIPSDLYEAAEIDGASGRQSFRHITWPLLQPVMTPAVILGVVWTFNNFNVPFVINAFELETSDTLVTGLYRSAFQYYRFGFAGAYAFIIFGLLLVFTIVYVRWSGALRSVT
jgi:arabinogalactan oligomer / maltooligosaccharide transport system permease protein